MTHILVRHSVGDFEKWKGAYDAHASTRAGAGSQGAQAFRNSADDGEVVILMEWDSLEKGRAFTESAELKQAMQEAGAAGPTGIRFLAHADQSAH